MKILRMSALALVLAVGTLVPASLVAQSAAHLMMAPGELKWADVPSLPPGAKIAVIEGPMNEAVPFTARIRLPANYVIPPHSHPAIEHVTVISGSLNMGMGDSVDKSRTRALPAGSFALMPSGANHYVWTRKEAVVQIHGMGPWGITYVNPADDPRQK